MTDFRLPKLPANQDTGYASLREGIAALINDVEESYPATEFTRLLSEWVREELPLGGPDWMCGNRELAAEPANLAHLGSYYHDLHRRVFSQVRHYGASHGWEAVSLGSRARLAIHANRWWHTSYALRLLRDEDDGTALWEFKVFPPKPDDSLTFQIHSRPNPSPFATTKAPLYDRPEGVRSNKDWADELITGFHAIFDR